MFIPPSKTIVLYVKTLLLFLLETALKVVSLSVSLHKTIVSWNEMVKNDVVSIATIEDLQQYVYRTLCADNELLSDAFPKSTIPLRRSTGEICGLMFCVSGPRTVEFTAIWENENNRIFFYDPNGKRYRQARLEKAPTGEIKYYTNSIKYDTE